MKSFRWYLIIIAIFSVLSAITYYLQVQIFEKPQDTFFYMFQDFAFVPINVLFVTLILDRLLKQRENSALLNKLNMVIGIFFHKIGDDLLKYFSQCDIECENISLELAVEISWDEKKYDEKIKYFKNHTVSVNVSTEFLTKVREFLMGEREFIINLLGNPNLMEHDSFTNLLRAVFHLTDELYHRPDLSSLPEKDVDHLKGDIVRAYSQLVVQWLEYLKHLKHDYPYLYSVAVRTNPFNSEADVHIK